MRLEKRLDVAEMATRQRPRVSLLWNMPGFEEALIAAGLDVGALRTMANPLPAIPSDVLHTLLRSLETVGANNDLPKVSNSCGA
jgi:hypothetical protein